MISMKNLIFDFSVETLVKIILFFSKN